MPQGKTEKILFWTSIVILGVLLMVLIIFSGGKSSVNPLSEAALRLAVMPDENTPVLGSEEAPATIVEFGDFQCVACASFFSTMEPELRARFIETGRARFAYKTLTFIDQYKENNVLRESYTAGKAGVCAQEQGMFWPLHDAIFDAEAREVAAGISNENSGNLTVVFLTDAITRQGANINSFRSCMEETRANAQLDVYAQNAVDAMGQQVSTPSVYVITADEMVYIENPFDISEYEKVIPKE